MMTYMDEDEMTFEELRARMQSPTKVTPKSGPRPVLAEGSAGGGARVHLYFSGSQIQILGTTIANVTVEPTTSGSKSPGWETPRVLDVRRPMTERVPTH